MKEEIRLEDVSLFSVSGVNIEDTLFALWISQRRIRFNNSVLITDKTFSRFPRWLTVITTEDYKFDSINKYNYFCVFELHKYVDTSFILLIQADGFVLRPKKWLNKFLQFDYIGAPWPIVENSYIDPFGNRQRVGNGGFSLRSKKLLSVPLNHAVEWDTNNKNFNHFGYELNSEDGIICVHNRKIYEDAGCIFAPISVAAEFATEHKLIESRKSFGFHKNIPSYYQRIRVIFLRVLFRIVIKREFDFNED